MADFEKDLQNEFDQEPPMNHFSGAAVVEQRAQKDRNRRILFMTLAGLLCVFFLLLIILLIGAFVKNSGGQGSEQDSGLPTDKIVWTTQTLSEDEMNHGSLVLSDETHAYTRSDTDSSLVKIYDYRASHHAENLYQFAGMTQYMDEAAMAALDTMLSDCATVTGCTQVTIRLAYITAEEMAACKGSLRDKALDYKTGLGCDMVLYDTTVKTNRALKSNETVYNWLLENAAKYGFILRYPTDKTDITGVADYVNYFRYVGVPHATYMKQNNLSLEEYLEVLKTYTSKDRLSVMGMDGKTYEVYLSAATGSVSVPQNYAYEISGTNTGSVVVTIDRSSLVLPETDTEAESAGEPVESGTEAGTSSVFVGQ